MRWPIVTHTPHKYIRWQESKHHQKWFFRWAQYSTYFFEVFSLPFLNRAMYDSQLSKIFSDTCVTWKYLEILPNAVDFHKFIYNLWTRKTFCGFLFYDFSSKLSRLLREEFAAKNLQVSLLGRKGERELRSRRCSPPADQPPWIEFSGGAPQIRLICLLWKVFLYLHASCHNKVSQSVWAVHVWSGLQKCQKLSPIFFSFTSKKILWDVYEWKRIENLDISFEEWIRFQLFITLNRFNTLFSGPYSSVPNNRLGS